MEHDYELMNRRISKLERVVGTLITWLHSELGGRAVNDLLDMLSTEPPRPHEQPQLTAELSRRLVETIVEYVRSRGQEPDPNHLNNISIKLKDGTSMNIPFYVNF